MPSDPRDPIPPGGVRVDRLIEEARRNAAEKLRADAKPSSPTAAGMPNWFSNKPIQPSDPRYDRLLWTEGLGRKLREQVQAAFSATPSIKRTPSIS
jgi:hypothetical protein